MIQVTPELLNGKANELRTLRAQHDEAMSKMRTLILGLNEIWKGDAQTALVTKYEGMQSTFTNFSQMLEEYAKLMDISAKEMGDADAHLTVTIGSVFGN